MRLLPVVLLGAFAAGPAAAWGPQGHEVVGAMADQLIAGTPTAKKVRTIVGNALKNSANWADCARSVELNKGVWAYTQRGKWPACKAYENADSEQAMIAFVKRNASRCAANASYAQCRHKSYHFTDVAIQQKRYDPALPGTAPNDLVQAINATIIVLQGGKSPPPFDIQGKKEALRLLSHYVGDLHQPLHVGSIYLDDAGHPLDPATPEQAHAHSNAGGNAIQIQGRKLHQLWDDVPDALAKQLMTGGVAEARKVKPTPGAPAGWASTWAGETVGDAAQVFQGLSFGAKLPAAGAMPAAWPASAAEPAYRQARAALQHEQLVKAGARLAQILKTVFP